MDARPNGARRTLDQLIERLHARGRLRVWSLVITIFGDAVVPRGGRVALAALQEVMERLRVEPGALRTALSRLAGDQWVTRERQGRNSYFSLSAHGRHAFDLATRRIYAGGPPCWEGKWTVAVAPPGSGDAASAELAGLGFIRVGSGVHLRPETAEAPAAGAALDDMLVIHGASAEHPEAFRALWPSDDLARAYQAFVAGFQPLLQALRAPTPLSPLDAMAARTLVIHDWRRIVLRDPGLPPALLPQDWPGEEARALARDAFCLLREPSEAWLDAAGLPPLTEPAQFSRRWEGQSSR